MTHGAWQVRRKFAAQAFGFLLFSFSLFFREFSPTHAETFATDMKIYSATGAGVGGWVAEGRWGVISG